MPLVPLWKRRESGFARFKRPGRLAVCLLPVLLSAAPVRVQGQTNRAPTTVGTITDRTLAPDADAVTIDVASAFSDPDSDSLTYGAESDDSQRLTAEVTGSTLTLTPVSPGRMMVAVTATDPGGLSAEQTFTVTLTVGADDYDMDDDDLIEVSTLVQLDAIRYDLNGDGDVDSPFEWPSYFAAFSDGVWDMGCPNTCAGYELEADLDFDTNGSDGPDVADRYWNDGAGWAPIGSELAPFTAILEGNAHTVENLYILVVRGSVILKGVGLVGVTGASSAIRRIGMLNVDIGRQSSYDRFGEWVGGLVGFNRGVVHASYSTGDVEASGDAGGLVGYNAGTVEWSYSTASAHSNRFAGGLVGFNVESGTVRGCYAAGLVDGYRPGGLVGGHLGSIIASYAIGMARPTEGDSSATPRPGARSLRATREARLSRWVRVRPPQSRTATGGERRACCPLSTFPFSIWE